MKTEIGKERYKGENWEPGLIHRIVVTGRKTIEIIVLPNDNDKNNLYQGGNATLKYTDKEYGDTWNYLKSTLKQGNIRSKYQDFLKYTLQKSSSKLSDKEYFTCVLLLFEIARRTGDRVSYLECDEVEDAINAALEINKIDLLLDMFVKTNDDPSVKGLEGFKKTGKLRKAAYKEIMEEKQTKKKKQDATSKDLEDRFNKLKMNDEGEQSTSRKK